VKRTSVKKYYLWLKRNESKTITADMLVTKGYPTKRSAYEDKPHEPEKYELWEIFLSAIPTGETR
jgi:hypothetical protein